MAQHRSSNGQASKKKRTKVIRSKQVTVKIVQVRPGFSDDKIVYPTMKVAKRAIHRATQSGLLAEVALSGERRQGRGGRKSRA